MLEAPSLGSQAEPALMSPSLRVSLDSTLLWPPQHELLDAGIEVLASDPLGRTPKVHVHVFSNEPADALAGDQHHGPDALVQPGELQLRSERSATGDGRVYVVLVTATNETGERATRCMTAVVPRSHSASWISRVRSEAAEAQSHCDHHKTAPSAYVLVAQGPLTPTLRPIRPIVECVNEAESGEHLAVFGYQNENPSPVALPLGPNNTFRPAPIDRGQPTTFSPGRSPSSKAAFVVAFREPELTWSLNGRIVTASAAGNRCLHPPATPEAEDDAATTPRAMPVLIPVLANDRDPQGNPLSVIRITQAAHGTAAIGSPGIVTFTPATGFVGTDSFAYTVSDGAFGTDQAMVRVTVANLHNKPPLVNAGPDLAITLPNTATLDGTATDDGLPAGSMLALRWTKLSGSGSVAFSNPASASTRASFVEPGTYELELGATDGLLSGTARVMVTVTQRALAGSNASADEKATDRAPATIADSAPEVLFVVGSSSLNAGDASIRARLANSNYTLTVKAASETATADADGKSLVLVSESVSPSEVGTKFRTVSVPVVSLEPGIYGSLGMTRTAAGTDFGTQTAQTRVTIVASSHPLATGLTGTIPVTLSTGSFAWGKPGPAAVKVATINGSTTRAAAFAYTTGAAMPGLSAPARRVGLFASAAIPTALNTNGWALFDAAIRWAIGSETLFVVGSTTLVPADKVMKRFLEDGGYVVTVKTGSAAVAADATGKKVVVISSTANPNDVNTKFKTAAVPVITGNVALFDDMGLTGAAAGQSGTLASQTALTILSAAHPMAAGLSGNVVITTTSSDVSWGIPTSAATTIASVLGDPTRASIFGYEAGAAMVGMTAPARRVALFLASPTPASLTGDGWGLVRAALAWATSSSASHSCLRPLDLMQVMDRSGSMAGQKLADAKRAAKSLVDSVHLTIDQVGIASFSTTATLDHGLSRDSASLKAAIDAQVASGATNIGSGIEAARRELVESERRRAEAIPIELLLTDGKNTDGDPFGPAAAAKAAGIRIIAVGLGADVDETELRRIASNSFDYYSAPTSADLSWTFSLIAGTICSNEPPLVDAGPDQAVALSEMATLQGTATDDGRPSGSVLSVIWRKASGPGDVTFDPPNATNTTAAFSAAGTYVLELEATDGVLTATDAVTVTVQQNDAPMVDAGPDRTVTLPATVALAGSATDDGLPAGSTLVVTWRRVFGPADVTFTPPSAAQATASFGAAGTYVLELEATDGVLRATDTVTVTVEPQNHAPIVNAGPDRTITLPDAVTLAGSATDDGLPVGSTLAIAWSKVSGPGDVTFTPPSAAQATASFSAAGTYVLELGATDGVLAAADAVTVTVDQPSQRTVSVSDVIVDEGHSGTTESTITLSLSSPSEHRVSVDYVAVDGTAVEACDYVKRFGTVTFESGQTSKSAAVTVLGDLVPEAPEMFRVILGNPVHAAVGDGEGIVTIVDDDSSNLRPSSPQDRSPLDDAKGVPASPTLAWSASDPDGGALTYDVYFGTAFETGGQAWQRHCPATAGPGRRSGAATAYDDAGDRLLAFGGAGDEGDAADLWILSNATGAGGAPAWRVVTLDGGPSPRRRASAVYDEASDRLVIHGGCEGSCESSLADTWVLTGSNGAEPQWLRLPDGPVGRAGHAAAYDAAQRRLIVFGGSTGSADLGDVQILRDATGGGAPAWEALNPSGDPPGGRSGMAMAYDATSGRLVLFGGRRLGHSVAGESVLNDVWVLSGARGLPGDAHWQRLTVTGLLPAPRWGHAMAYEPASKRLVVFGGTGVGFVSGRNVVANDLWMLSGADGTSGSPSWSKIKASQAQPLGRLLASVAYSETRSRMVVALGENNRTTPPRLDDLWTLSDPAGSPPKVSPNQTAPSYEASTPDDGATYLWRIVTRDAKGAMNGSRVFRFSLNAPPEVSAGLDRIVDFPGPVPMNGSVTDDGLPTAGTLTSSWSKLSGPGNVVFEDDVPATTVTLSQPGVYVLRLQANDSRLSRTDNVTLTVNAAPEVDSGGDLSIAADHTVLTGTASDDGLPASVLTLQWSKVDGTGSVAFAHPTSETTEVAFDTPGEYTLRLTADDTHRQSADDVRVTVGSFPDLVVQAVDSSDAHYDGQTLEISGTVSARIVNEAGASAATFQGTLRGPERQQRVRRRRRHGPRIGPGGRHRRRCRDHRRRDRERHRRVSRQSHPRLRR